MKYTFLDIYIEICHIYGIYSICSIYHIYGIYYSIISTDMCLHLRAPRHRDRGRDGVRGVRHPVCHTDRDRV